VFRGTAHGDVAISPGWLRDAALELNVVSFFREGLRELLRTQDEPMWGATLGMENGYAKVANVLDAAFQVWHMPPSTGLVQDSNAPVDSQPT
jgi:hypothetical protein